MAAYTEYSPGPTVAEQHNSVQNLLDAFYSIAALERSGGIGGSASRTWYISGFSATGGANPSLNIVWAETTATDTATSIVRYNAALLGTLDPSWALLQIAYFINWMQAYAHGDWNTHRTRSGGTAGWLSILNSYWTGLFVNLTGGGSFEQSTAVTAITYSDGARAGQVLALDCRAVYNPSAGELTAGVRQLAMGATIFPTDVDTTANVGTVGTALGEVVLQIPVPIAAPGSAAEQSWLGWTDSQVTSPKIVTHEDDLGGLDQISEEPPEVDAERIYNQAGAIPMLLDNPSSWGFLTTLRSALPAMLVAVGRWAVAFVTGGAIAGIAAAGTALTSLASALSTAGTSLSSIATSGSNTVAAIGSHATVVSAIPGAIDGVSNRLQSIETGALDVLATELPEIREGIDALAGAGDPTAIVDALGEIGDQHPTSISARLEAIDAQIGALPAGLVTNFATLAVQLDRIADSIEALTSTSPTPGLLPRAVEALECICDSLKADPGADPPVPRLAAGIRSLQDRLGDVADLTQTLRLKAKGMDVVATLGVEE